MLYSHHRVVKQHPGAGESHDIPDLFTHVWSVAMNAAVAAEGFAFHERAVVTALAGILCQFGAFCTESGLRAVLFMAERRIIRVTTSFSFSRFFSISVIMVYRRQIVFSDYIRNLVRCIA